jgi:hypothetical protein
MLVLGLSGQAVRAGLLPTANALIMYQPIVLVLPVGT